VRAKAAANREARTRRMIEGSIGPTLARLAAPNIIAVFVMSAISIAEGYFAAQLGVTALAGLALVFPLARLTQMLSSGAMGGAISSAVARALGSRNTSRASGLTVAAWSIAVAASALIALLMGVFGRDGFELLGGGDAGVVAAALAYAGVFFPGCVTLWLCNASLSIVRGTGNMLTPSLFQLGVSLASIPLSGALALGWGPFPALGMAGLAAGLIAAFGAGALVAIGYILSGRIGLSLKGALASLERGLFADILRVGLLGSLNAIQTVLTILLMVGLVSRHGANALAGYGLGARLEMMMVPIVFGIGAAMTAMIGANIGAGARQRALRIAWAGALTAAFIVGGIGCVAAIEPDLWLRLFLDAAEIGVLDAGRTYFHIVGPFYAFFALGLALYFASQGAGRVIWPVAASLFRMAAAFGGALLLTETTDLGVVGVFVPIAAGMLIYGLVTAASVKLTAWR
jgi:MATE family, multidrug efflux pump